MPSPETLGLDTQKTIREVVQTVEAYESENSERLSAIDRYWRIYKGNREKARPLYGETPFEGVSNSFVYESPRAVDSLSTTRYRLIMSHDPPFEPVSVRGDMDEGALYRQSALYSYQMEKVKYPRYLRKALTSLELIGNSAVEMNWMQFPMGWPSPIFEATSFTPRPLSQIFFSSNAVSFDMADKKGSIDLVTNAYLHRSMAGDPNQEAWIHSGIQEVLRDAQDESKVPQTVRNRMTNAGQKDFKGLKELILYHGPLEDQGVYDPFTIGIVNRSYLVRFHFQILPWSPLLFAFTNEIEQEAWALGVGPKGEHLQRMMNANRDRIFNVILFSLFQMMKMSRYAGIRQSDLRIKPFNIIPMDDIKGLDPLKVDVHAANYGILMEEKMKEEFQSYTAATKNIQAITTSVTATEATLVMDSAQRRISVDTEIIADIFLRDYLYYSHKMNQLFLDRPIWLNITGPGGLPASFRMMPDEAARDIDFKLKISTDKDFRPNMSRRIIEFLQAITSVRQQLPPDLQLNLKPYIEMFTRLAGIDPRTVFQLPPVPMQQAMQGLARFSSPAQQPPIGALQEAVLRGIESNPERFAAEREPVTETRQGGMVRERVFAG